MERLCDDILASVLKRVSHSEDRTSCSEVSKQWYKVEGLTRSFLCALKPNILPRFLPRFPNLVTFKAPKGISDSDLKLLAITCPKLEVLDLNTVWAKDSIGNDGICVVAMSCHNLREVCLGNRDEVRDVGMMALIESNSNVVSLDLECVGITDQALEVIGAVATSLQVLNLCACYQISDSGLVALASGYVSRTLKKLILAGCDRITDNGVYPLQQMQYLEELSLSSCTSITDIGCVAVSAIRTLEILDLSLCNISDVTLVAISRNCPNLVSLTVIGCNLITGVGIRSFASHTSLETLVLLLCPSNVYWVDIEHTVLGCQSLRLLRLDRILRTSMPPKIKENIASSCTVDWL